MYVSALSLQPMSAPNGEKVYLFLLGLHYRFEYGIPKLGKFIFLIWLNSILKL